MINELYVAYGLRVDSKTLSADDKCFEAVLFYEQESIEEHITIKQHMRNFINLKIGTLFNFSFQDYLNLTMYGAEMLIDIAREYKEQVTNQEVKEEAKLIQHFQSKVSNKE